LILQSARLAANQLLEPRSRALVWKTVGLTILMFFGMWFALQMLASTYLTPMLGAWPWIAAAIVWLLGAGVFIGAGFLLAPVTAIFAGLFLDDVARHVEEMDYPGDQPGVALPVSVSVWLAIKFTILVIAANLLALILVLLPGINLAIFFLLNGYLIGREYFQFAAMRFCSEIEAAALRKNHALEIFGSGLIIACFMAVPILNLFTPVFAATMMVHVHKTLSERATPSAG